jgi:hypothetical protein
MRLILVSLLFAQIALAQTQARSTVERVIEDAIVFDRVAQASKRDLPRDLLRRIIEEDIDLLRGKRGDGSYEYATFERFDSGRISDSFSIQPRENMETVEIKAPWVYRVIIEVPTRRLVLRKNNPVWIERVDLEYVGEQGTQTERQSVEVKTWLQPGEVKPVDLPAVARQATVRVVATVEPKGGYGNVAVSLVKAKIVDLPDSPYANAVGHAKAVQRGIDNGDIPSIRASAQRMRDALGGGVPAAFTGRPEPAAEPAAAPQVRDAATQLELQAELQLIEDLLTGNETERREGMDRLHQLIRRLRR